MANNEKIVTDHHSSSKMNRIFYLDNIRIYLIILVILHHLAVGYGGLGGWIIYESDFHIIDGLTMIVFTLFNAINQSYFMAFFFLLAGYFTPRSYEKKNGKNFLKDRLIRLGIPLLIYVIFISPFVEFIAVNFAYGRNIAFSDILINRINNFVVGVDHLWFLLALLIFAGIYILYKGLTTQNSSSNELKVPYMNSFPKDKVIIASIGLLAIITFVVRIFFLIGQTVVFNFQFAHFTHYAFCFWIGILAYNGKWFDNLPGYQAKRWVGVALLMVVLLPIILLTFIDLNNPDFTPFLGRLTLESLIYSVWESITLIAISIGLLYIFQTKLNRSNKLLENMAGSVYTAYIIHALVIVSIMIILLPFNISAIMKFAIGALIGVPLIFILSHFIRKIPYFSRVLG